MSHEIVSREDWIAARKELLAEEKALTRARDALAAKRRELPWVEVTKDYAFEGPDGRKLTLADLFGAKSQLLVKHFMFGPEWTEGCIGCSFEVDHIDGILPHLDQKDVVFVAVSRGPYALFAPFKERMGWTFDWVSSAGSDFNFDYQVSATEEELKRGSQYYNYEQTDGWTMDELSGVSVFVKDEAGRIFHAYSSYGRGFEEVLSTYAILDIMPKGREEAEGQNLSHWVKHHDRYPKKGEASATSSCCGH